MILEKLSSRKFWVCMAAFLASFGAGIAGMSMGNEILAAAGMFCTVFSASIYAAAEAAVDCARESSNSTRVETTTTIGATTTSKETVEKALAPVQQVAQQTTTTQSE